VRDIRVCRPSFGSGQPQTRPASWSGIITALIDCGRIPSARARLDTVAGPPSSRRSTTATCDGARSLCCPSARRSRLTLRNTVRISRATAEARSVSEEDVERLTKQVFHIYSLPVQFTCIAGVTYIGRPIFRHSFDTLLGGQRRECQTVQELLRHANSRITLDAYDASTSDHHVAEGTPLVGDEGSGLIADADLRTQPASSGAMSALTSPRSIALTSAS
jgi:hypothetical protein